MRQVVALVLIAGAAFGLALACASALPEPNIVITEGDATPQNLCGMACANGVAFCPAAFPADAGADAGANGIANMCSSTCQAHFALTPSTMPTVLNCEATATDKASYARCQGVSSCP